MLLAEVRVAYDSDAAIVRCSLKGLLTPEVVEKYERSLQQEVALARQKSPRVRMLFDSGEGLVQPAEIVKRLREVGDRVRRPGDRLAVVVGSALLKMQAERTTDAQNDEQVFRSVADAEAWLKS